MKNLEEERERETETKREMLEVCGFIKGCQQYCYTHTFNYI